MTWLMTSRKGGATITREEDGRFVGAARRYGAPFTVASLMRSERLEGKAEVRDVSVYASRILRCQNPVGRVSERDWCGKQAHGGDSKKQTSSLN